MAQRNPEFAERLFTSDVDIDGHPALKVSELVSIIDSSLQFLRDNSDRSRGRSHLMEVVYRDGKSDLQPLLFLFKVTI